MAKQVVWSKTAVADRIQILDYWFKRLGSKTYSRKLDQEFRNIISLLPRFPSLGRVIENRDERYILKHYYRIIYRLNSNKDIEILRIWDTRQDPENLKIPEQPP